jgi:hypothetical protein
VLDGVGVEGWLGLMRLKDCTPKLGLETFVPAVRLVLLKNTMMDGVSSDLVMVVGREHEV